MHSWGGKYACGRLSHMVNIIYTFIKRRRKVLRLLDFYCFYIFPLFWAPPKCGVLPNCFICGVLQILCSVNMRFCNTPPLNISRGACLTWLEGRRRAAGKVWYTKYSAALWKIAYCNTSSFKIWFADDQTQRSVTCFERSPCHNLCRTCLMTNLLLCIQFAEKTAHTTTTFYNCLYSDRGMKLPADPLWTS